MSNGTIARELRECEWASVGPREILTCSCYVQYTVQEYLVNALACTTTFTMISLKFV